MASSGKDKTSDWLVGLLISVLIATILLPKIMGNFRTMESDTTNFTAVEIALLSVAGVLIVVGFLYKIWKKSGA